MSKWFCLLSEKGSTLKGKNLLPVEANSLLLDSTPFHNELGFVLKKTGSHTVVSLGGNGDKSTKFIQSPLRI